MNFLQQSLPEPPPLVGHANGHLRPMTTPIYAMVEVITPELAKRYLECKNTKNRNLREAAVSQMQKDMAEGRWELTGQPIIFDSNGRVIDGHHRLNAIANGSVAVPILVVRNARPEAVRRVDTGSSRTAANIAQMDGHTSAANQVALARYLLIHERAGIDKMNTPKNHPTKAECVDEISLRPTMLLSIHKSLLLKKRRWVAPTIAAFCHYQFYQQNAVLCDRFWDELTGSGAGLKDTNPVLHLRNRLADNAAAKAKLPTLEIIALFFRAWATYRAGKGMKVLRWRSDGPRPEPFPTI